MIQEILYASPSLLKNLGFISSDEIIGHRISGHLHEDDRQIFESKIVNAIKETNVTTDSNERAEYCIYCRFRKAYGGYLIVELKGKPFPKYISDGPTQFIILSGREYRSVITLSIVIM